MPSIESQKYASKPNKTAHVNCKSKKDLKKFLLKFFNNVYIWLEPVSLAITNDY